MEEHLVAASEIIAFLDKHRSGDDYDIGDLEEVIAAIFAFIPPSSVLEAKESAIATLEERYDIDDDD